MEYKIINDDCLNVLDEMIEKGEKVDAIITDPPYGIFKDSDKNNWKSLEIKWDKKIDIKLFFPKYYKVLKPNGRLIMFSQEPTTSETIQNNPIIDLKFNYKAYWLKNTAGNSLGSKKALVNKIEEILIFTKQWDNQDHPLREYSKKFNEYINVNQQEICKILGNTGMQHFLGYKAKQFSIPTMQNYNKIADHFNLWFWPDFISYEKLQKINKNYQSKPTFNLPKNTKSKSNVFEYKKDNNRLHPTQKPVALMEEIIRTFTKENQLILDPFMGSASTGIAALKTNRKFIGVEKDKTYYEIAKKRIKEGK